MNVIIYDTSCGWLTHIFRLVAWCYVRLGLTQFVVGAPSWRYIEGFFGGMADRSIKNVQYWGHGHFGTVLCNHQELNTQGLVNFSKKLAPEATWWWRTCLSFAGVDGRMFAYRCANLLGCKVIGHTQIIWLWQGGMHTAFPGQTPEWPTGEGWTHGTSGRVGNWSWPWSKNKASIFSIGGS